LDFQQKGGPKLKAKNPPFFIEKINVLSPIYPSGIGVTDFNRSLSWVAKL
jgi:hypothetical protein